MTVTKAQLADAYSAALNAELGRDWDRTFSRRDASKFLDLLWRWFPTSRSRTRGRGRRAACRSAISAV